MDYCCNVRYASHPDQPHIIREIASNTWRGTGVVFVLAFGFLCLHLNGT